MKLNMVVFEDTKKFVDFVNEHNIKREDIQYIRTYANANYIDLIYWTDQNGNENKGE